MNKRFLCLAAIAAILLTAGPLLAATRVVTEPDRQVRPGVVVNVWGASCQNAGCALGDGSSNGQPYVWTFGLNPNVVVNGAGLAGNVANDKFVAGTVSFTLVGPNTRELITATLSVGGTPSSNSVTFDIVDPTDPISAAPLDNLAIDVNIAITQANEYLGQTQGADDCWNSATWGGISSKGATTGFTLWSLENSGHLPSNDPNQDVYTDWVRAGLLCLQGLTAVQLDTSALNADVARQAIAAGTSDLNANGQTQLTASSDGFGFNYSHPIATAAFISSLDTASYQTLVEDAVDYIGHAQSTNNGFGTFGRGGWDYSGPSSRSDYSINSWNWMVLEGAESTAFAIDIPDWILQESELTLISHQTNPPNQPIGQPYGYSDNVPLGFGADPGYAGHATTCAGLSGLAAVEFENVTLPPGSLISGEPAPLNSIAARRQEALDWMGDRWALDTNGGLAHGNRGNYYAMWTCCRAFRLTEDALGISRDSLTLVNGGTNFNWSTGEENGSGNVPPAGATREGYAPWLVREQLGNGAWNKGTYLGTELETALALLCLNPTVFGPPEPECPEDPEPRTQGFWHRQCLGLTEAEGGIDPGRNGRGPQSPTVENFSPELMDCAEDALVDLSLYGITTCEGMDADPPNDKCEKAIKQTTALILNQCWGELEPGCEVDVSAEGCDSTDVGSLLTELADLIQAGLDGDVASCQTAASCADAVNNGYALTNGGGYHASQPEPEQDAPAVRDTGDAKSKSVGRR